MKVLALTRYSAVAASARYRFYDLVEPLQERGIHLTISPLLPDDYVRSLRIGNARTAARIFSAYMRRLRELRSSKNWNLILIQYEALPFIPPRLEQMFLAGAAPFVL